MNHFRVNKFTRCFMKHFNRRQYTYSLHAPQLDFTYERVKRWNTFRLTTVQQTLKTLTNKCFKENQLHFIKISNVCQAFTVELHLVLELNTVKTTTKKKRKNSYCDWLSLKIKVYDYENSHKPAHEINMFLTFIHSFRHNRLLTPSLLLRLKYMFCANHGKTLMCHTRPAELQITWFVTLFLFVY